MSETRNSSDQRNENASSGGANDQARQSTTADQVSGWLASTAVRTGLVFIGVVLLLFALGQAVGIPLLSMFAEAISSQTGQWLMVALFAVAIISIGARWGR